MEWLLFVFLLVPFVLSQENFVAITCPVPGSPDYASEEQCNSYTACEYTYEKCHMKDNEVAGYVVSSVTDTSERGVQATLTKADETVTMFGADIIELKLEVIYHEEYHVQIKIYDPRATRYEVPMKLNLPENNDETSIYTVELSSAGSPFQLNVTRKSTGTNVFELTGPLTFEDQFIQITTKLPSIYMYGIGERSHTALLNPFYPRQTYTLFARDQPVENSNVNQYGSHPYYVNVEDDLGNTHSVLFYSSNAIEISSFYLTDGSPSITTRSIGGIIDLHIFMGPTPEEVNIQYANTIGKPDFPPYWSFGFQLSRFGYLTIDNYREVRDRMKAAGIPQDVQVFDIDYMENYRDFTYDPVNWNGFPELIQELHNDNVKVVLIFDPAVAIDWDNYAPASRGRDNDVYIKWNSPDLVPADQPDGSNDYMVGYVWPNNKTVFPDFFNPSAVQWWTNEVALFHQTLDFDGIWIDMNEPANFGTNENRPFNYPPDQPDWSLKCPDNNSLDDPPYPTMTAYNGGSKISTKTICMSGLQTNGDSIFNHYDVHNLYGFTETLATAEAMENIFPGQKHLILSRSTFVGSGASAVHWLGDNSASWDHMQMSIIGMIEFNMFSIPMVGADVCGFFNEPSEQMCIRWMQLGAFYPFDRNHNTNQTADQDPAKPGWDMAPSISRDVLLLRYQYIPYMYSKFYRAHVYGESVIRPLFNVFPSDLLARDINDQFMWGRELLVAPILYDNTYERSVYFPSSVWYDLVTGELTTSWSNTITVSVPLEKIPVFVRGGSILPFQEPAITTTESRQNPFGLTVAFDSNGEATGELFWDDGISEYSSNNSFIAEVTCSADTLYLVAQGNLLAAEGLRLETIQIFGYPNEPMGIYVNGEQDGLSFSYNITIEVLSIILDVPLNQNLTVVFDNELL